jgi:hypothetical protein
MAVIVEDRLGLGEGVVKILGRVGLQEEIVVDEGFHNIGLMGPIEPRG